MVEEKEKEAPQAEEKKEIPAETAEVEIPKNLAKIVQEIEEMKVVDLAELVKVLEKKFGVSAMPVATVAAPAAGAAPTGGEEKQFFSVNLTAAGEKKIEVIKIVRDVTQKGLKEAKDLVDATESGPQVILEKVKTEEAEELKKKLEQAGASVELK